MQLKFEVEGTVRASMDGLISAEGSCGFVAEKRFPKIPKTKVPWHLDISFVSCKSSEIV